jgi:hypothetical protein
MCLQDVLCRRFVQGVPGARSTHALFMQVSLRRVGGQALVHEASFNAETPLQPLSEPARKTRHFMGRLVRRKRHADHQCHRPPLADQRADGRKARAVVCCMYGRQRVRDSHFEVAHGNTDALFTVVEREHRARFGPLRGAI